MPSRLVLSDVFVLIRHDWPFLTVVDAFKASLIFIKECEDSFLAHTDSNTVKCEEGPDHWPGDGQDPEIRDVSES